MRFTPASLPGVWIIDLEPRSDERGWFSRTWCEQEFAGHRLNTHWPQGNLTHTRMAGTIRGLHWQAEPLPEIKLIRCSSGAIWDVVVDVRPDSPTFGRWAAWDLTGENNRQLYVPAGFAHGFQTLTDNAEVTYLMSAPYQPELARGCRWDDPELAISWPRSLSMISERDRNLPVLSLAKGARAHSNRP